MLFTPFVGVARCTYSGLTNEKRNYILHSHLNILSKTLIEQSENSPGDLCYTSEICSIDHIL